MRRGVNKKVFSGVLISVVLTIILVSFILPWFGGLFEKEISFSPIEFSVSNIQPSAYKSNASINLLKKGDKYYLDRTYTITSDVPAYLADSKKILTKNDLFAQTTFTTNNPARVYLAWDLREKVPTGWKSSTLADLKVTDGDASGKGTLKLIFKDFPKGNVIVPSRVNIAYSNYIIFVKNISFATPIPPLGVVNPGFESALHPTTDWSYSRMNATANVSRDSTQKHSGSNSLKIVGRGYSLNHATLLKNAAGKKFTLTLWAKNNSAVKISNKVGVQSSKTNLGLVSGSGINFAGLSNEWKQFSSTFTLPSDAGINYHILLATEPTNLGTIWFDDIKLVETGTIPPTTNAGSCIWPPVGGVKMAENNSLMNWYGSIENRILCYYGVWQVSYLRDGADISVHKKSTTNPKGYVVRQEGAKVGSWIIKNGIWVEQSSLPTTCSDSDGGEFSGVKGTANNGSSSKTDICASATSVDESYCDGKVVKTKTIACGTGKICTDGKCETKVILKPVDLLSAVVEPHVCEGYIDVKCVMNDTFDDTSKQSTGLVSNISATSLVDYLGNLSSAPKTYIHRIYVEKSLRGKYSLGCLHVRYAPSYSVIETLKQDYSIGSCPESGTMNQCTLPVLKSNGDYESKIYDIGDRRIVNSDSAYCAVGGKWKLQRDVNDECDKDYECLSDNCDENNECTAPSVSSVRCNTTGTATIGVGAKFGTKYCSTNGVLVNLKPTGTSCAYVYECTSNVCADGFCDTTDSTTECTFEGDCNYGEECSEGSCVPILVDLECSSDEECDGDEECSSSGNCVSITPSGCITDGDCIDGEKCDDDGQCKSGSALFWTLFFVLLILSIGVLVAIWVVYKNKKIGSEPGRKKPVTGSSNVPPFSLRPVAGPRRF